MKKIPRNILAFRFSALGDVAMTAPVIREFLSEYKDSKVCMVSRKEYAALFEGIDRLQFYGVDLDDYDGFFGLRKLAKEISSEIDYDAIVDFHDVFRTQSLRLWMYRPGIPVGVIGKGRAAKRKLTRRYNKKLKQLKLTVQRYADVFADVGAPFELHNELKRDTNRSLSAKLLGLLGPKKSNWIGIAPFARHKTKRMPLEKAEAVIEILSELPNVKILLFGGGKVEELKLQGIAEDYSNVYNIAGKMSLHDELDLISQLDVMVSMDSANMHLASLLGVPVVSVWGGTHPYIGFLGYGQSITNSVQIDLACRPCSVFGDKPCYRGDYACLTRLQEDEILIKVTPFLTNYTS